MTRLFVVAVAFVTTIVVEDGAPTPGLANWDSGWYNAIARHGYSYTPDVQSNVAFFPLYPLTIRLLQPITRDAVLAGVIVSHIAFLGGLLFVYRLALLHTDSDRVARRTVLYIACFPTAFFFSAVYSESLFLCLSVGSLYFSRRGDWWRAGILGALASATRVVGVLLLPVLMLELLRAAGWAPSTLRDREQLSSALLRLWGRRIDLLALMFVPLGLAAFAALTYVTLDEPFAFFKVQDAFHRESIGLPLAFVKSVVLLIVYPEGAFRVGLDVAAVVIAGALLVPIWRRIDPIYAIYVVLIVLVPASSWAFRWGTSRYALVAFPIFLAMAMLVQRNAVHRAIVVASVAGLAAVTVSFAAGRVVA